MCSNDERIKDGLVQKGGADGAREWRRLRSVLSYGAMVSGKCSYKFRLGSVTRLEVAR